MRFAARRCAVILLAVVACGSARAESCRPDSVLGLFDGTAKASGLGEVDVTLNLLCDKGAYVAQIFTSIGDLEVSAARSANGTVALAFDTGASLGTMELRLAGERLSGEFLVTSDKGAIDLARKGPPLAVDGMKAKLELTPQQWAEDIDALATGLAKRHANAFFFLPKAKFEQQIAALKRDVPSLNNDQIFVRLAQFVNAIGDGHTGIVSPDDRRSLPIELTTFGREMRVTAAGAAFESANGAQVLKIGEMDIAKARALALTLTPSQELPELREGRIVFYLARGLNLHGLGITPSRDHAVFTLRDDAGKTLTVDLPAAAPGQDAQIKPGYPKTGLRYQRENETFWCQDLAPAKAVYCAFHAYQDLKAKAEAMFALIDKVHPEKLVIDMRDNGGGDNTEGDAHLVKPLSARADLNRKGHLFVLIGPLTFSAAMNNAAQFQDETQATLVGETIGEKPNSFQEPRQFRLPNSHLIVRASTLYYEFRKHGPNAVHPDKEIIPTWADMKAGRDPELEWVLAR